MFSRTFPFVAFLLGGALISHSIKAQQTDHPTDRVTLEQYLDFEDVQEPRLSPDGRQVIYTRRWIDKTNDKWESSLWIMNSDGSRNRLLLNGSSARWSADGTRIAFLAEGKPSGTQLWVRWMDGEGAATQITRVAQTLSDIAWSPDGKSIAFRMFVPAEDKWKIEMPSAPKGAKWTEAPRVVTKMSYRMDRQGFIDDGYRHVFVVPADGGTPRQVTSGDWEHGAPAWMPDGKTIVFDALRIENAEHAYDESEIYAVNVVSGAIQQLTQRKGTDAGPIPSPDGRFIAYAGHDSTDDVWVDDKLYVMNADGSGVRTLAGTLDRYPIRPIWARDGSGLYFSAENEGSRNLYFAPLTGAARQVTKGAQMLTVFDIDRNGQAVGIASSPYKPNDVVTFTLGNPKPRQITAVNDDILSGKKLGEVEEIWYPSLEGFRIQGWIVKPPDFDAKRKYPMMLVIHGGPHSMYNVAFNYSWQEHAAKGYVVLYTNPRGSTGYGSAFGNAIKFNYPGKDYNDLMTGVDTVINRGYIDTRNLFVYGCSGGGILTAWVVTHTDRFTAASSNCPVINWFSMGGTTDINQWSYHRFAKYPWEDPDAYLSHSPIMYVANVKTPTMLMTGVNDLRTPISQTEEFYQALKILRVPTAMIRFNDEWHGTSSKPSNFLRTQLYLRSWFERWGTAGKERTASR
ncbi:MAG: S9 family peptidase [Anaerolineae bacterium]|nr:S9 family peptidase [Gemmatimonadaceae bacterium]